MHFQICRRVCAIEMVLERRRQCGELFGDGDIGRQRPETRSVFRRLLDIRLAIEVDDRVLPRVGGEVAVQIDNEREGLSDIDSLRRADEVDLGQAVDRAAVHELRPGRELAAHGLEHLGDRRRQDGTLPFGDSRNAGRRSGGTFRGDLPLADGHEVRNLIA